MTAMRLGDPRYEQRREDLEALVEYSATLPKFQIDLPAAFWFGSAASGEAFETAVETAVARASWRWEGL